MEDIVFLNIVLFIILCNFVSKKKCIMNEIVVTLDKDADAGLLRKMIQNMKGVVKTSIRKKPARIERRYKRRELDQKDERVKLRH